MKRIHKNTTTLAAMAALVIIAPQAADAALLAHWKFDENSGNTATDEVGSYVASDPGTLGRVTGVAGSAVRNPELRLDDSGAGNFTTTTFAGSDSEVLNSVSSVTVSFWAKPVDAQDSFTGLVGFEGTGASPNEPYGFKMTGETLQWGVDENYSVDSANFFTTTTSGGTTWAHVVGTYNHTTGLAELYINGALADSGNLGTDRIPLSTRKFSIGTYGNSSSYNFEGDMDDVQVYNSALDSTEVASLFANPGLDLATIPEPSTTALLGLGGLALILRRRK